MIRDVDARTDCLGPVGKVVLAGLESVLEPLKGSYLQEAQQTVRETRFAVSLLRDQQNLQSGAALHLLATGGCRQHFES